MKLSALASIIKDCGRCSQITAAYGHRFISTGHAVYNMDGYPKAQNKNELAAMLSIPSKKVEDIYFEEERAENNIYYGASLADDPDNEEPVDKLNTRIVVNGEEYIALRHPSGTIGFIRTALLGPVESELTKEYAAICVRWGNWRNGTPVYAVKDGMYLRALILPAKLGGATTDDLSEILANMLECQQSEKKEEKADD